MNTWDHYAGVALGATIQAFRHMERKEKIIFACDYADAMVKESEKRREDKIASARKSFESDSVDILNAPRACSFCNKFVPGGEYHDCKVVVENTVESVAGKDNAVPQMQSDRETTLDLKELRFILAWFIKNCDWGLDDDMRSWSVNHSSNVVAGDGTRTRKAITSLDAAIVATQVRIVDPINEKMLEALKMIEIFDIMEIARFGAQDIAAEQIVSDVSAAVRDAVKSAEGVFVYHFPKR